MQELDEAVVLQMKPYKEFFDKEGFSPNLCFDIGANEGRYSRVMHSIFDVEVHSFEPVGETYSILTESISQDFYPNIKTFNFGFSETEETKTLVVPNSSKRSNSGLYSTYYKPEEGTSPVEAQFKNMEKWCREQDTYPDLIKLDVEGSELEILRSIRGPTLDGVRAIIVEVNYDEKFPDPGLVNILLLENRFKAIFPDLSYIATIKSFKQASPGSARNIYYQKAYI